MTIVKVQIKKQNTTHVITIAGQTVFELDEQMYLLRVEKRERDFVVAAI